MFVSADEVFESLNQEILEKFLALNPDYATELGLHEPYDWQLADGSTKRLLDNLHLEEEWIRRLKQTVKREELGDRHRLEWDIIGKWHEDDKFLFCERRVHELNPDAFDILGGILFLMFTRNYAPLETRVDAMAARIEKMPRYLEEFRSRFEKSHPVKLWTEIAIESAQSIGGLFQFIAFATKDKVSEPVYAKLCKAVENLEPALKTHLEWLQGLLPKTVEGWALGKDKFERLIKLRDLGMTSEEVLKLGYEYLEKLKTERKQLVEHIAPGKTVEEVFKTIEAKAPKSFEEALEFTRKTMIEARDFVQKQNLATVYPEDVLLVEETPAFIAPLIPFAAMIMPAKFDKPQIGVYIVTRPKDEANLGKHLNFASVRNTAVHEAYPGHFLQGSVTNRGSIILLLAGGTETAEGWAHYCEELMAKKGFSGGLEARLIRVNDGVWRAVRIIVDVKLSRGEMRFEEAVDMLVREAGLSREAATAEVRRYTQTPGYPLSYLLGKHLILKLKEDLKKTMGDGFDEKLFHDTITANGYLPVSMLRKVFEKNNNGQI